MSGLIEAEAERVWKALTEPDELVAWDDRISAQVESPGPANNDYPREGQRLRWRYRLGSVQLVLYEQLEEIVPQRRLRSRLAMGSMRFEQIYSLQPDETGTRIALKVVTPNSIPILGGTVDRFEVRRLATEYANAKIRSLQKWCTRYGAPRAPSGRDPRSDRG